MIVNHNEFVRHEAEMFANNKIPYLLPFNVIHRDMNHEVVHQMDGVMPLSYYLREHSLDRQVYRMICESICGAISSANDYLLSVENIQLGIESCYMNESSVIFMYVPRIVDGDSIKLKDSLMSFFFSLEASLSQMDTLLFEQHHQVMMSLKEEPFNLSVFTDFLKKQVLNYV